MMILIDASLGAILVLWVLVPIFHSRHEEKARRLGDVNLYHQLRHWAARPRKSDWRLL